MEFGLDQDSSNLVAGRFTAGLSQIPLRYSGRRLLRGWLQTCVIGQIPARCRSATSLGPVCDQDSGVIEFGFKRAGL